MPGVRADDRFYGGPAVEVYAHQSVMEREGQRATLCTQELFASHTNQRTRVFQKVVQAGCPSWLQSLLACIYMLLVFAEIDINIWSTLEFIQIPPNCTARQRQHSAYAFMPSI